MTTLADSLVSSSSRKLPIRKRPDLQARRQRYQGRVYWVVKDPVALQYFRFEEEEFAILQMLDGESSLDEISERFEAEFPPQSIRTEELQQFIGMLHRSGLVITDSEGQGVQLCKRRDEQVHKRRMAMLGNILSLRFKGIDPDRILNFIYPYLRWFFTMQATVCVLLLAASALALVVVEFDVFQQKLPSFHTFFSAQNWLFLSITLGVTKVLHEFGHGLSCKHFGGECHEMGIMFLVLTPCLYCNVSDSWMLPNRWHRAAIGAAGMYVELVLASIATFIWWFSEPGPLHYLCLNVMFICSVSTLMFNANPLLRYDGYYILSDILEIPNLRQKATSILSRKLGALCLGLEQPDDPFLPKRHQLLFAFYSVAAALYRWVVVLSILYFLNKVFEPYGLKIIGQLIALGAAYGLVVQPLVTLYKFFKVPGRLVKVKKLRLYGTIAFAVAVLVAIFSIPFPARVYCSLVVQPLNAASAYVDVDGILEAVHIVPGQRVEKGDVLAELSNLELDIEIADLAGQRDAYQSRIDGLRRISYEFDRSGAQITEAKEGLANVEKRLEKRTADAKRLRVLAPRSGTVMPPPLVPEQPATEGHLPSWFGSPLDPENLGATLTRGTKICQIGDPRKLEARILIDQNDVALVQEGQEVDVLLRQEAEMVYVSKIEKKSTEDLKATPRQLSSLSGGDVPTQMDKGGVPRPLTPYFEAVVPLPPEAADVLRIGLVGRAKVTVEPQTIWQRLVRYVSRTFNFEL